MIPPLLNVTLYLQGSGKEEKNLSATEAVQFAISPESYSSVFETGCSSTILSVWGHSDHTRIWEKLDNPKIEIDLKPEKLRLLKELAQKENVNVETAVTYFLIFTMETLGYHI